MSFVQGVRSSLSAKISAALAVALVALTAVVAYYVTHRETRLTEELTLEKARVAARIGARQYGEVLEQIIDGGTLTTADVFDRNYVEIKGYSWGPHPKYHTRYDAIVDRAVIVFEDTFLEYEDFVYAVGVDENGYLPTHNSRYQQPLTGDPAKDGPGNRTKRMFANPVELAAAKNLQPSLLQTYHRDTGEVMWDVSSPIFVKGRHWGGFRVGVSMERIAARQRGRTLALLAVFAVFALLTVGAVYLVVRRAMRPVARLTRQAEQISLGEALDEPIKPTTTDEIGQLTRTIDRLRVSMKAAISRLGQ